MASRELLILPDTQGLSVSTSVVVIPTTKRGVGQSVELGNGAWDEAALRKGQFPAAVHQSWPHALGGSSPSYLPAAQPLGLLTYLHGTDNSILEVRIQ